MYRSQSIFLLGTILVCLTATAAIAKPSHNREIVAPQGQIFTAKPVAHSVSTQAADLLTPNNQVQNSQLAKVPLDLDKFCQNYPYNSRCEDRPILDTTESEVELKTKDRDFNTSSSQRKSGWAIAPEISTLGLGGSVVRKITPQFNARVGVNGFGVGFDIEETDVTYDADLNLFNVSTLVDFHPSSNSGFRISGGLVFTDNNVEGTATNNGTITIGGQTFNANQLGSVDADVEVTNGVSPYLGIGGGNAVGESKGLGFWWNLGVVFGGSPEINVTPNIVAGVSDDVRQDIQQAAEEEAQKIEDDIDFISVYPVATLGLSYQF